MNNLTLDKIIRRNAEAAAARDAGDDAEVLNVLNAKTIEKPDSRAWSLQKIGEEVGARLGDPAQGLLARRLFGDTLAEAIEAKVEGFGELQVAQIALGLGELTLDGADRQAVIDGLGAAWPPEILAAVKSLGGEVLSPVENEVGRGAVVTAGQVASWRIFHDLENRIRENYNQTMEDIAAGTISNWAEASASLTA